MTDAIYFDSPAGFRAWLDGKLSSVDGERHIQRFTPRKPTSNYRTMAIWWVVSAKRAETRERRLVTLIADSAAGGG